jgi:hypothetical protein
MIDAPSYSGAESASRDQTHALFGQTRLFPQLFSGSTK